MLKSVCSCMFHHSFIQSARWALARPRQILPAILSAKYRRIERAEIAGKIGAKYRDVGSNRCLILGFPWFSRIHCPGRDHVTEISLGFTVDSHNFGRTQDTCVEIRVKKLTLRFYETLYGIVRELDKIHVFPEQNGAKYRDSCARLGKISKISQQHFAAKYRGERSRICLGLGTPLFRGGGNKLVKLVPGVHNTVKVVFLNFTSCFAFRGPINGRVRVHFSAWVHI